MHIEQHVANSSQKIVYDKPHIIVKKGGKSWIVFYSKLDFVMLDFVMIRDA